MCAGTTEGPALLGTTSGDRAIRIKEVPAHLSSHAADRYVQSTIPGSAAGLSRASRACRHDSFCAVQFCSVRPAGVHTCAGMGLGSMQGV